MYKRQKVVLYGDSVVLAGIRASLAPYDLDLITLDTGRATKEELCALKPSVVIFDMQAVRPAFHYDLARVLPNLLMIGIDMECNHVLTWSGQQLSEMTTQDLVNLIGRLEIENAEF
jgi:hypothetical protein